MCLLVSHFLYLSKRLFGMDGSNCHCLSILIKPMTVILYKFQNIIIFVLELEKCFRFFFLKYNIKLKGKWVKICFIILCPKITLIKHNKLNQRVIKDDSWAHTTFEHNGLYWNHHKPLIYAKIVTKNAIDLTRFFGN